MLLFLLLVSDFDRSAASLFSLRVLLTPRDIARGEPERELLKIGELGPKQSVWNVSDDWQRVSGDTGMVGRHNCHAPMIA